MHNLMGRVTRIVISKSKGEVRFTSLDMMYAYGQTELHPDTARHCNIQTMGDKTTGTYAFNERYYDNFGSFSKNHA